MAFCGGGASVADSARVSPGTVYEGDWLGLASRLERGSVDMLYADPPFNTGSSKRGSGGVYADAWASVDSWSAWLEARLVATLPALKATGSVLIHVDWRTVHHVRLLLDGVLGSSCFVNQLVWSYGLGGSSPRRFARKHDDIVVYSLVADGHFFEAPMVAATSNRMRGRQKKATDVLAIPAINNMARERTGWPTQKPMALLEMLVGAFCPAGGVVVDPCCGSGTTLAAAAKLGRRWIGFDASAAAVGIARDRLGLEVSPTAGGLR